MRWRGAAGDEPDGSTVFAADVGTVNSVLNFRTDVEGNVYLVDSSGEIFRLEPLP